MNQTTNKQNTFPTGGPQNTFLIAAPKNIQWQIVQSGKQASLCAPSLHTHTRTHGVFAGPGLCTTFALSDFFLEVMFKLFCFTVWFSSPEGHLKAALAVRFLSGRILWHLYTISHKFHLGYDAHVCAPVEVTSTQTQL